MEELPGKSNYFIGNDPKKWRTNIAAYARVRLEEVYPGVDLVYYGNQGQLEYDFVVRPGTDPSAIKLAVTSAPSVAKIDAEGDLVVQADGGEVRFHKPVIYQTALAESGRETTEKTLIAGRYTINEQNEVAFAISDYDRTKPLVIDPVLVYSTYLGGSTSTGPYATTSVNAIAVDSSGSAYVSGSTATSDFPTAPYAFQTANHGSGDAFVSKFTADGSAVVYSTFLGGSGGDTANGLAVDSSGDAYVTGTTRSTDFPTVNPLQATGHWNTFFCCASTSFVAKLNGTGSRLIYSTYLGSAQGGGGVGDVARGIAVDGSGNAYVTGLTDSADFPTANAIQPTNQARSDPATNGFVSEINANGSALVYSTYLGGSGSGSGGDESDAIAVDASGNAYITGDTRSTNFPNTPNALQPTCTPGPAGCKEAFVTKIGAGGSALSYSTFMNQAGLGLGIAADGSGNAYVTGIGAFVAKLNPTGSSLVYFTQLGTGQGNGIAVDGSGNAYVTGFTRSSDFPVKSNAFQPTNRTFNGYYYVATGFVTKISPPEANLAISSSAPSSVASGSTLTYTFVVTNQGPDPANNVSIETAIPAGATFNSVSVSAGSCTAPGAGGRGNVTCTAASLASGNSITETLVINVTAGSGATIRDTASASSATLDPNSADNEATATTTVI